MKNLRYNIDKKQLLKWKKKKKEEVINIKKEQKLAQKDIKKKFKQELKNEKISSGILLKTGASLAILKTILKFGGRALCQRLR